jgi:ribosomal protein L7/L12
MMGISLLIIILILGVLLLLVVLAVVIALQNRQTENDSMRGSPLSPRPQTWSGEPAPYVGTSLYGQVKDYLRQGNRIEAVKVYLEATGASLREAEDAVNRIERGLSGDLPADPTRPVGDLSSQVVELLRKGRKIEAIKIYRDATGEGLKESKDAVEAIERTL